MYRLISFIKYLIHTAKLVFQDCFCCKALFIVMGFTHSKKLFTVEKQAPLLFYNPANTIALTLILVQTYAALSLIAKLINLR
jgi:hypothetical protein